MGLGSGCAAGAVSSAAAECRGSGVSTVCPAGIEALVALLKPLGEQQTHNREVNVVAPHHPHVS